MSRKGPWELCRPAVEGDAGLVFQWRTNPATGKAQVLLNKPPGARYGLHCVVETIDTERARQFVDAHRGALCEVTGLGEWSGLGLEIMEREPCGADQPRDYLPFRDAVRIACQLRFSLGCPISLVFSEEQRGFRAMRRRDAPREGEAVALELTCQNLEDLYILESNPRAWELYVSKFRPRVG
jgi:hypothetical protein